MPLKRLRINHGMPVQSKLNQVERKSSKIKRKLNTTRPRGTRTAFIRSYGCQPLPALFHPSMCATVTWVCGLGSWLGCDWDRDGVGIGIGIAAGMALISHTSNVAGTGNEFPLQPPADAFVPFGFALLSQPPCSQLPDFPVAPLTPWPPNPLTRSSARAIWIAKPLQCHRLNGLTVQLPRPLDKHEHEHLDREWASIGEDLLRIHFFMIS